MPRPRKNSGVAPVGAVPRALMAITFFSSGCQMSACVSPPQASVSHIVQVAASIAHAASTALPPRSKIFAPAVAPSGLPVIASQWRAWSGGLAVAAPGARCGTSERRMAARTTGTMGAMGASDRRMSSPRSRAQV